jgi:sugar phosphate permease
MSEKYGSPLIAALSLLISGLVCLLYPILPSDLVSIKLTFLILWGFFVISDSPLYSSISAQAAPKDLVGTALVTQNCIGFSISIISIFISTYLFPLIGERIAWILLPGPVIGLIYFCRLIGKNY